MCVGLFYFADSEQRSDHLWTVCTFVFLVFLEEFHSYYVSQLLLLLNSVTPVITG